MTPLPFSVRSVVFAVFILAVAALLSGVIMGSDWSVRISDTSKYMEIKSPAFKHNGAIPKTYTCDGENINPPLEISGIPKGTKSLALIVDDPDAPSGLWVHWTAWNIPATNNTIASGFPLEKATEGITSFGRPGYGGPCPPSGEHRYFFKIYALDVELALPPDADKEMLEEAIVGHVLDKAEIVGLYER